MTQPISATELEPIVREVTRGILEKLRANEKGAATPAAAMCSFEAERLIAEMILVGKKLWARGYVDGNGGNLSIRISENHVLCTPTMLSKGDLTPVDICLSDLEGTILAGQRERTSELLLHLEIYNANPRARAVLHCHPPHATAFAITGAPPPVGLIPEHELLIGPVALTPYETPGTKAFAETILPFVRQHNSILLANHGVVCWADTLTHAEWLVEILDTYCKTVLLAQQLGRPLTFIPEHKIAELLEVKRRMGFPDARLPESESSNECAAPGFQSANEEDIRDAVRTALANLGF
jgi:L-fuculose-phosphate aldolase